MAIIAAPITDPRPRVALRQQKSHQGSSPLVLLGPLVNHALQLQQILSSVTCQIFLRTYFAAKILATGLLLASSLIALRALITSRFLAVGVSGLTTSLLKPFMNSRRSRRFRKNLELELYHLLFGPLGYAMFLMLFWPGWIVLAVIVRALWP